MVVSEAGRSPHPSGHLVAFFSECVFDGCCDWFGAASVVAVAVDSY